MDDLDLVSTEDLMTALQKRADTFVCCHWKEGNPGTWWWMAGERLDLLAILMALQDTLNDWRIRNTKTHGVDVFDEHLAARLAENEE